jgi:osmoprotectant transport system permease protein
VLLHPSKNVIAGLIGNRNNVYEYVKREFDKQYQLTWLRPIGFNNAYALMMRRKQAQQLGIQTISDLKHYLEKE